MSFLKGEPVSSREILKTYLSNPKSTFEWADITYTAGGGITFFTISLDL